MLWSKAGKDGLFEVIPGSAPNPLLDHIPFWIDQEEVWLVTVTELPLERFRFRVIDVQVNEVDISSIFCFEPVHDGS